MKTKLFHLLSFLMLSWGIKAQNVNIPDANFKARLLSASTGQNFVKDLNGNYFTIDMNGDGEIQQNEADQVGEIQIQSINNTITDITGIQNFTNLEKLTIISEKIPTINLSGLSKLKHFIYYQNTLTSLTNPSLNIEGTNLSTLIIPEFGISNLNIQHCPNLEFFNFNSNPNLSVDLQSLPNLKYLSCRNNQLSSLSGDNLTLLEFLDCSNNQISTLNLSNSNNLASLICSNNQLSTLDLLNKNNLGYLDCSYNNLTSLDASMMLTHNVPSTLPPDILYLTPFSDALDCSHNQLQSLNISGIRLQEINFSYNNLTHVNFDNVSAFLGINGSNNQLTSVDLSNYSNFVPYIETLNLSNNTLTTLIFKNSVNDFGPYTNLSGNPNLHFICCDDEEISAAKTLINQYGYNCNVNSYCSFTPGGNYNTITGTVRFDENNNGCDTNDEIFEHLKLKINDGTNTGETFVKNDGKYNFYSQTGDLTVTTEPENPSLYTVSPSTFTVNFSDNNNNISTQNICITKNGNVKDLEVVFAPITDARPGFDAVYKVIWRNKGNSTLSGNVVVTFDNSRMSFQSSSLASTVTGNKVAFNFTDLKPYANNSSEITFKINTPTHPTNPVNNGDILSFNANIPVMGDPNPADNDFIFNQTVVGSFDPNDITCLQGDTIPTSMVGNYLHYIVNFENTGTAPATNIVVEMEINPDDFDISSLQLQNTSHSTYTKITGNKVEFMMKDINLAALAHGNIVLKIKSKNNLVSGDSVSNKANIYFDYNFPVETNEAITTINNASLGTVETIQNSKINIYPNPTKGNVNIETDSKIKSIEIYDVQGRIIQKQMGINSNNAKLSIHGSANGIYLFKITTEKETVMKKIIKN